MSIPIDPVINATDTPNCQTPNQGQPLSCYGDINTSGCAHYFIRSSKWGYDYKSNSYIDAKGRAEYVCISTLINARGGRRANNVESIQCLFIDIDGNRTDKDNLLKHLKDLGDLQPLVINSSRGNFQLAYCFDNALPYSPKGKEYKVWKIVQRALADWLISLGFPVDTKPLFDIVRLRRNENAKGILNTKHGEPFKVNVVQDGVKVALSDMYRAMKRLGFIRQPEKPDKTPLTRSRERLYRFFRDNPLWKRHPVAVSTSYGHS